MPLTLADAECKRALSALREQFGMAVLMITPNMGVIAEVADWVAVMYAGRVSNRRR